MVAALFEVLAEPNRRRILDELRAGDRSVGDLVELLDVGQPTVSKHLRALREAGLVVVRPDAQRRWYRLRPEPLRELDAWLAPYREAWAGRLDALAAHLDRVSPLPGGAGDAQAATGGVVVVADTTEVSAPPPPCRTPPGRPRHPPPMERHGLDNRKDTE
jgi:DNA-binding transcriptional ArsR family regulator